MRSLRFLAVFALISSAYPVLAAEKFSLDSSHSKIGFTATLAGVSDVEGRFVDVDAAIMYDEADLTRSTMTVIIKTASIDTADADRDRDLKAADFFDVQKFPAIRFQSTRVEKRGDAWVLVGSLTMKSVTKVVEIPFLWRHRAGPDIWGNRRIGFDARLSLNRKDYGVEGPAFWNKAISDAIEIQLQISAEIPNYAQWGIGAPEGKKAIGAIILDLIDHDGVDAALARYPELAKDSNNFCSPRQLSTVGRKLLEKGKKKEGLAVMKKNAELYPDSALALSGLGDAYLENGDRAAAMGTFKRVLQLAPDDVGAIESLR